MSRPRFLHFYLFICQTINFSPSIQIIRPKDNPRQLLYFQIKSIQKPAIAELSVEIQVFIAEKAEDCTHFEGRGFFLWSAPSPGYPFKWSYDFVIQSEK
jgi:hypothetical protein